MSVFMIPYDRLPGPRAVEVMDAMRNLDRHTAGWEDVQVLIDASKQLETMERIEEARREREEGGAPGAG